MVTIDGAEAISEVFTIFHDGVITGAQVEDQNLLLSVDIMYLAERIDPSFRSFEIALWPIRDIRFTTWPKGPEATPRELADVASIFQPELDILSGDMVNGQVGVVCNQDSPDVDYCGGRLSFSVDRARVTDEGGRCYSLDELDRVCRDYWDAWKARHKERK